jgi:hypothetical protein
MGAEIDFNNAPSWATGYGLRQGAFGIEEVWFNAEQYQPLHGDKRYGPYPFGGGTGPHMHNETMGNIKFQQHRPEPWSGEGLPPVGTACEVYNTDLASPEFERCTILFSGKHRVVYDSESCHERTAFIESLTFRHIRTPEQIAADERLHSIRNACSAIADTLDDLRGKTKMERAALRVIEAMIDAGYSKEAP